ncbi:MAG: tRNA epoxyqueuosine(34) reductase QueG, partial [Myxococcales bacterium]|nr:tRNA epoxyqueuosine(34) reductase QueG [Myxococcales bacterium]
DVGVDLAVDRDALVIDPPLLARLAAVAEEHGLLRLGVARLDHPGFAPARAALDRFHAAGKQGEMAFMERTRAIRRDPARMLEGARSLLVALVPYAGEPGPVARYAQTADYHTVIHERLLAVESALRTALPGVEALICVDTKPVLERAAAMLAGLGFLGKSGCLIAPGLGSYVLLGALLCTARWSGPDARPAPSLPSAPWDACGACTRCLDACPTQAFDGPGDLDPRRCISYLTIEHRGPVPDALADRLGERVAGCDVCQEVCPYNAGVARHDRVPTPAWLPPPPGRAREFELPRVATLGNSQHRALVRHTALRRIPRRHLRRNALLALGNRDAPLSTREREAIEAGREDREPQVARAAERAARRRGLPDREDPR